MVDMKFGYHPNLPALQAGPLKISPLPNLAELVEKLSTGDDVENNWIYAPAQQVQVFGTTVVQQRPYPNRVFGMPKTHILEHTHPDDADHLNFHLWVLSFLTGMRLTSAEAGFLDSTPIKPGVLNDFFLDDDSLSEMLGLAEAFWIRHRTDRRRAQWVAAAIHALFVAKNPRHLQFEEFVYNYTALDALFALAKSLNPQQGSTIGHTKRIQWMCSLFGIPVPLWADQVTGLQVAAIRNATLHEALFMGAPLGFSLLNADANGNIPLQMSALICRLLVALIGADQVGYIRTPIDSRARHVLRL